MPTVCQKYISSFLEWLSSDLAALDLDGACEVTTPFLDRHNDHIQIYIREQNGSFVLSDEGNTVSDMLASGVDFQQQSRQELLKFVLDGYNVSLTDDELKLDATDANIGQRMNFLIQAIIGVNNTFSIPTQFQSRDKREDQFKLDAIDFLTSRGFSHNSGTRVIGKTGYTHSMETITQRSNGNAATTHYFKSFNTPSKPSISKFLFDVQDIVGRKGSNGKSVAFLNDQEKPVRDDDIAALIEYDVIPACWTQREEFSSELDNL